MLWPAQRMGDMVIRLGFPYRVTTSPCPRPPHPHDPAPLFGPIYLWMTPAFPQVNTLINSMPACTAGAMGYSLPYPCGLPAPPSMLNMTYWRRYLLNIPKSLMLVALTLMANLGIAGISALFVSTRFRHRNVKDVTGVDTSSWSGTWGSIKESFSAYTQWSTWNQAPTPPVPYPGGLGLGRHRQPQRHGERRPDSPFVAPLMATSCTNLIIVPNAATVGFSNAFTTGTIGRPQSRRCGFADCRPARTCSIG